MKKLFGFILVSAGLSIGAHAQKHTIAEVPAAVKSAFTQQFPGGTARWEKGEDQYTAHFKRQRQKMSAVYTADGTLVETEMELEVGQLPLPVRDYVAQHYRGSKITEAARITRANGQTNYKACIKGGDMRFDASCTLLTEKGQPVTKF